MSTTRHLVLLAAVVFSSCRSATLPDETPTITGQILERPERNVASVFIKGTEACGLVLSLKDTRIMRRQPDGSLTKASSADLMVGMQVRAWVFGAIAESCPGQASADAIEILPGQ